MVLYNVWKKPKNIDRYHWGEAEDQKTLQEINTWKTMGNISGPIYFQFIPANLGVNFNQYWH